MISSSQSKLIRSLHKKKYRDLYGAFLIEGEKMVLEVASAGSQNQFQVQELFASPGWIESHGSVLQQSGVKVTEASPDEIKKVSNLVTPQPVIAVVSKAADHFRLEELLQKPVLAFESIRDPGNLGTIIRTADWFGIRHIVCTPDSTDLYNPKVVQSTMGAITRVKVHYLEFEALFNTRVIQQKTVFGTFMEGENIYETPLGPDPLILFGNESHGLSESLSPHIQYRVSIPSFSPEGPGSESLNIASSVAVVCSELRRREPGTIQSGS